MRVHLGVKGDVGEKVLGVRDVSERLFQWKSELVTGHRFLSLVTSIYPTRRHIHLRSVLIQADVAFPLAIL